MYVVCICCRGGVPIFVNHQRKSNVCKRVFTHELLAWSDLPSQTIYIHVILVCYLYSPMQFGRISVYYCCKMGLLLFPVELPFFLEGILLQRCSREDNIETRVCFDFSFYFISLNIRIIHIDTFVLFRYIANACTNFKRTGFRTNSRHIPRIQLIHRNVTLCHETHQIYPLCCLG